MFAAILGARIVDLRKLDTIEQLAEYIVELDIGDNGSATSIESDTTNACHWFEFAEILKLMGHDQIAQEILNDDTSSSSDCESTSDSGSELELVPFNEAIQGQTVSSAKIKKQFLSTQKASPQTAHHSGRQQGSNVAHGSTIQPTRLSKCEN
ncbi:hypothetical protein JQC92_21565 [Shewanella sp. 202IG2-18]|uniref:hypothetical protein n=1 Tax=Parashewanella hymeniacidonis TaxID=2807618 RepID=UPI00196220BC|nr:hypothetical protein [Parashewanella hymeniacidonis]MBM7074571.1 hypothetical protein [Parashewanella hymeniacidonis]